MNNNSIFRNFCKLLPVVLLLATTTVNAQEKVYDSVAIQLLDRMSDIIGDLHSCKIVMHTSEEKTDSTYGKLTSIKQHKVFLSGPDKFVITSKGDDNSAGYWYNSKELYYYSFTHNHYGLMETGGESTISVIDQVHEKYDIDFPAADFFYPSFTDDLIAQSDHIEFLGPVELGEKRCYKIAANGEKFSAELWLAAEVVTLPVKFILRHKDKAGLRYEADFLEWELNTDLPDAIFDFSVPPDATPLIIVPKN